MESVLTPSVAAPSVAKVVVLAVEENVEGYSPASPYAVLVPYSSSELKVEDQTPAGRTGPIAGLSQVRQAA